MASNPTRNGTAVVNPATGKNPEKGERGALGRVDSLISYGAVGSPTIAQIEQMLREDPWAESVEGAITWPIRSAKFDIEEAEGDGGEAEACRAMFLSPQYAGGMKTPIEGVIAQMTGAFARRVSFHEICWADGEVNGEAMDVIYKIAYRDPTTCEIETDDYGSMVGFRQRAYSRRRGYINDVFLGSKALVYVHDGAANPLTGKSAFESSYRNYRDKKKLLFLYYKALEKFGAPPTIGKTESDRLEDQEAMFEKSETIRSNGTVGLGPGESIDFPQVEAVGEQFKDALRYLDFLTAVANYVQFLALAQEGNSGAYALSKDHHDLLNIVSMGRMAEIASAFTNQVIAPFVMFNFGRDAAFPAFKFRSLVEADKERALEFWKEVLLKLGIPVEKKILDALQEKALQALDINPERGSPAKPGTERAEGDDGGEEEGDAEAPSGQSTTAVDPVVQQATAALRRQVSS